MERYWEESHLKWEGDLGEDFLGPDHPSRFEVIALLFQRRPELRKLNAHLLVTREQISSLVQALQVQNSEALIDRLWEIAGRHLRPLHRQLLGSDLKATAATLKRLTSAAANLEQILGEVPPVTCAFISDVHRQLPSRYRITEELDLDALDRSVGDLAHAAYFATGQVARERKRPVQVMRKQTLHDAVEAVEAATGTKVRNTWVVKDQKKLEFKGPAGDVIRSFMKLVEPKASERSLVLLLQEIRAAEKGTSNSPDK